MSDYRTQIRASVAEATTMDELAEKLVAGAADTCSDIEPGCVDPDLVDYAAHLCLGTIKTVREIEAAQAAGN